MSRIKRGTHIPDKRYPDYHPYESRPKPVEKPKTEAVLPENRSDWLPPVTRKQLMGGR